MRTKSFRFELGWFQHPGFREQLMRVWPVRLQKGVLDYWHLLMPCIRRWLRGWGANKTSDTKKHKKLIEHKLREIDAKAEDRELFYHEWSERYELEKEVEKIYFLEEIWWQLRCGEKWILQGMLIPCFFMGWRMAENARGIFFLYRMGRAQFLILPKFRPTFMIITRNFLEGKGVEMCILDLSDDVWGTNLRLSEEDKLDLVKPFTFQEIDEVIKRMKSNTSPGPDGFSVGFYKNMWPKFRVLVKEMLDELHQGSLDTDRLKYGVVTLLPKVLDANTIKQYSPICVQNVIIKILTKTINERVARVADKIISWTQTAFIPRRNILEGCVILHETLHELKRKGEKGVIFKIDFEKAYDRVNWGFLYEVMKKNNFSPELISWVKKFNEGAKVSINIYGD